MCLIIPANAQKIKEETILKIKKVHKKSFIYGYKILHKRNGVFYSAVRSYRWTDPWGNIRNYNFSSRIGVELYSWECEEVNDGFHFYLKYKDTLPTSLTIVRFKIPLDKIVAFGVNSAGFSEGFVATECYFDKIIK